VSKDASVILAISALVLAGLALYGRRCERRASMVARVAQQAAETPEEVVPMDGMPEASQTTGEAL